MNRTDCVVSSSPNAEIAKITERGPKNTRQYVAIASASHKCGLTINKMPIHFHIKDSDWICLSALYLEFCYFTIKTEIFDSCTNEFATLPRTLPLKPPIPFEPITIRSTFALSANLTISVAGFPTRILNAK